MLKKILKGDDRSNVYFDRSCVFKNRCKNACKNARIMKSNFERKYTLMNVVFSSHGYGYEIVFSDNHPVRFYPTVVEQGDFAWYCAIHTTLPLQRGYSTERCVLWLGILTSQFLFFLSFMNCLRYCIFRSSNLVGLEQCALCARS